MIANVGMFMFGLGLGVLLRMTACHKLRQQLSDAEDKFQALVALSHVKLANVTGQPVQTHLNAGDTLTLRHPVLGRDVLITTSAETILTVQG